MAAKLSDLVDEMSGVYLQNEGHADVPPQSAKDLWKPEALDSSPFHLPSWSPAWRLPFSCPDTKHCLEICVTLTELGCSFLWQMFNGRGLTMDEARDVTFLLTEEGTSVGKLAYLTADPMTIQEGRRPIAQAISDHQVKMRGPGCPM